MIQFVSDIISIKKTNGQAFAQCLALQMELIVYICLHALLRHVNGTERVSSNVSDISTMNLCYCKKEILPKPIISSIINFIKRC